MKKNKMIEPEIEFVKFEACDIITASGGQPQKTSMTPAGASGDDGYITGFGFDDPLQ